MPHLSVVTGIVPPRPASLRRSRRNPFICFSEPWQS